MEREEIVAKIATYVRACRRGTEWLMNRMNPDGSIGPEGCRLCYYRVPWSFALMGELPVAIRLLDWIGSHMFSPSGAFEGVSDRGIFATRFGSYPIACLLIGAAMMQRFEIVYPGTRHLLAWQDPETGGFHNSLDDMTDRGEQELFPTAQGGMSLLMTGQIAAARKTGGWLKRLWDLQPDVESKLYHVFTRSGGLFTDYAPEQETAYLTKKNEPWQHHYNGGIAAAFLTKLFTATGDEKWLDLAKQYQAFSMTTDECQFQSMQVCKSGWGSGLLYVATKEERYQDWTIKLGDWFVEHQFEDGHWENTKALLPNPTEADNLEITAEFVMHLANIIANVSV